MYKLQIPYEQLLEIIQEGIWVIDADSNTTYVNPKMAEILGCEVEEMIGKHLFKCMDEEEVQNAERKVESRKKGIAEFHESRLKHKDGHDVYVEIKTVPITDDEGNYNGAVAGVTDITKRKQVEEALQARERFLATTLETTIDGFWVVDIQKRISMVNDAYCTMSGYSREELLNMTINDIEVNETPEVTSARIKRIIENGPELFETCHRRKDGTIFPLEISATYLPENGGQFICFCRDITERKLLEQELSRSEERFQKMLSLVPDLVSIHDADMNIVYSNWKGFGAVPEEKRILDTKCYNTYRGLDQICPDCYAITVLQSGEVVQKEVELLEGMWVDLRVIPILGKDHTVEYFVEWVRDITLRKITEKEILAQQKLLEGIMDNVSDVLSIQYPDHSIERYNRAGYDLLGMTPEEVRGKKCHQLIGQANKCEECATTKALQSGKLEQVERYFPELGLYFDCRTNPVFEDGNIVWVIQHMRDITERKKAEEALQVSEERFRVAQEISPDGFTILHAVRNEKGEVVDFTWVYENQAIASINGTDPQEVIGKRVLDLLPAHRGTAIFEAYIDVENTGKTQIFEEVYVGEIISKPTWLRLVIVPMAGDIAILAQDITERKKTQEALKLQASERAAVDTFTYSVSSDLQAPLRRIEGFSEALLEECPGELSDQARNYLNRIVAQVGSMKNLTDALLQLSRVVSREIDREKFDLSALTRSNIEKLQYQEPERQLELVIAPGLIAEGDTELLNLMLSKLLDNAWKFTSRVEKARIEFGSTEQDGRTVYYLKDNGVGFNMSYAEKLFVPFQKLHSENAYPGIGIGLNLVYRIISRHGGEIWAEGEPGKGACFCFTLP